MRMTGPMGRKFQEALDSIARAIPDDPEKRRTMARGLCGVAGDLLAGLRPSAALECARLAEICTPGDPGVERLIAACEKHQGRIEKKLEAVAMTVIDETNRHAASQRRWGAFLAAWRTWIIAIVLIKFFAFGMRGCFHSSRDTPPGLGETRIQKKYGEGKRRSGKIQKPRPKPAENETTD
jgi:hypothetical protein